MWFCLFDVNIEQMTPNKLPVLTSDIRENRRARHGADVQGHNVYPINIILVSSHFCSESRIYW